MRTQPIRSSLYRRQGDTIPALTAPRLDAATYYAIIPPLPGGCRLLLHGSVPCLAYSLTLQQAQFLLLPQQMPFLVVPSLVRLHASNWSTLG